MRRFAAFQLAPVVVAIAALGCQGPAPDMRVAAATAASTPHAAPSGPGATALPSTASSTAIVTAANGAPAPAATHAASWPVPQALPSVSDAVPNPVPGHTAAPVVPPGTVAHAPVPAAADAGPRVVPDAVIVTLQPGTDEAAVLAANNAAGFTRRDALTLHGQRVLSLRAPAGVSLMEAIARMRAVPGVLRAGENPIRRRAAFAFTKPDPRYTEQWAHRPDRANTEAAWSVVPASTQTKVIAAVLDSGLDVTHPEFAGRIQGAANFTGGGAQPDTDVTDQDGHGTHVTGILAATGDNGVGVAGVAWGVQILPVKVLDQDGAGDDFTILKGLSYAIHYRPTPDNGARVRVVNMSLGGNGGPVNALWTDAVAEANAAGIVVVAASGNDGVEAVGTPANTPGVVAVGSTASYLAWESLSAFSNYGDRLDLVAPGEGILSTAPTLGSHVGKDYAYDSGTSMASPFVAGVAALVCARYDPNSTDLTATFASRVRSRLLRAVDDMGAPGRDPLYGEGRINAGKAVAPATLDDQP